MYSVILGRLGTDSVVINLLVREPAVMGDRERRWRERERERETGGREKISDITNYCCIGGPCD